MTEQRARTLAAKLSLPHQGLRPGPSAPARAGRTGAGRGRGLHGCGAGYGKTAFIVDLLSSTSGRTVYYSVDERRSRSGPLSHLSDGRLWAWSIPAGRPYRPWAGRSRGGTMGPSSTLPPRLVDFMSDQAGQATLVAIDDLHLIDSSPHGGERSRADRSGPAPGWTILLSSRRRVPLRVDGVTLGDGWCELRGRELRLTPARGGRLGRAELGRATCSRPRRGLCGG